MTQRKAIATNTRAREGEIADPRDEICRRVMEGESLRSICSDSTMPDKSTVFRWLAADEDFRRAYVMAKAIMGFEMEDEIKEIADTPLIGERRTTKSDGTVEIVKGDMVEHRKLQVDARKWLLSKLQPRRWGDATMLKLGDLDGQPLREMSHTEKVVRLCSILDEVQRRKARE